MKNPYIEVIKEDAKALGACNLINNIKSWKTLANVLFSIQGLEFLEKHKGFPTYGLCQNIASKMRVHNVYVDTGKVILTKLHRAMLIGNTDAEIYCHGASTLHTFVVMYGARLVIHARNYAVVRVYNLGGTIVEMGDGTAKILK